MTRRLNFHAVVFSLAILFLTAGTTAQADVPAERDVKGMLMRIEGVPVLQLWGTPEEQGFAHGYLLADEIVRLFDLFLGSGTVVTAEQYEHGLLAKLPPFKIEPRYEAEMRAILKGMEAKRGGPVTIAALGRTVRFDDLKAAVCMGDLLRGGCSSFAAWGSMTGDGDLIAGRNMDWSKNPAFVDAAIVFVRAAPPESGRLGFVSVNWPGLAGCVTGMNAEGVTVATHDSGGYGPSIAEGFTPMNLIYREAIETARAATAVEDIRKVLKKRHARVGTNMFVTRPNTGEGPPAFVFEFDGNRTVGYGIALREPEDGAEHLLCTNHYRKRLEPAPGWRYPRLEKNIESIVGKEWQEHLDVDAAWTMLAGVSITAVITHHSAVFEPDKRLLHVAFARDGVHAPRCGKVTLDVGWLLGGE